MFKTNDHLTTKQKLVFALIVSGAILVGLYSWLTQAGMANEHHVVLTEDGFFPVELTIGVGDTVTFVNKTNQEFWPASDLHPTHGAYSEFDPLEPLPIDGKWSFTFDRLGAWGYHDHLRPGFKGKITVNDTEIMAALSLDKIENCLGLEDIGQLRQCWNEFIISEYEKGGLKQGFAAFTHLYINDPTFSEECHGYTHTLGDLAYDTYQKGGELEVSKEVAYCTYGFFHGFMESLIHDTGTYDGMREFCDFINEKLKDDTRSVGPCLHGIGHGVTDASDPRSYGDHTKYTKPGLALCELVGRTEYEIKICATGVFNALAGMMLVDDYGLVLDHNDVYAVCRDFDRPSFREACYEDFKIIPIEIENKDFEKALTHPVKTPDDLHYQQIAVDLVGMMYVYSIHGNDFAYATNACNDLADSHRQHCIKGLASGFTLIGIPDREYERALDFCAYEGLQTEDVAACYDRVQWESLHRFPSQVVEIICTRVPEPYKTYCYDRDAYIL